MAPRSPAQYDARLAVRLPRDVLNPDQHVSIEALTHLKSDLRNVAHLTDLLNNFGYPTRNAVTGGGYIFYIPPPDRYLNRYVEGKQGRTVTLPRYRPFRLRSHRYLNSHSRSWFIAITPLFTKALSTR
jgi:hypothetical protein